jgi:hypothetical protein
MERHNFLDTGATSQFGERTYRLCGIEGCGRVGNHPIHRDPSAPKRRGILDSDRHAFHPGSSGRCMTCGKARQSDRHRGFEALVPPLRPTQAPAPAQIPRAHAQAFISGEPLMMIALGYAGALQAVAEVPGLVRFHAGQLARAIEQALAREEAVAPQAPPPVLEQEDVAERKVRRLLQSGTPAVRRAFRSGRVRQLFERAMEAGWSWRRTGGGHIIIDSPGQAHHVSLSTTMSDRGLGRGWENTKAEAKRKGLDIAGL